MMKEMIIMRKGSEFKVIFDDEDYEKFKSLNWNIGNSSRHKKTNKFYVRHGKNIKGKVKYLYLHRAIMNTLPGFVVDHLNGNGLDCRKVNMVVTTQRENAQAHRQNHNNKHNKKDEVNEADAVDELGGFV